MTGFHEEPQMNSETLINIGTHHAMEILVYSQRGDPAEMFWHGRTGPRIREHRLWMEGVIPVGNNRGQRFRLLLDAEKGESGKLLLGSEEAPSGVRLKVRTARLLPDLDHLFLLNEPTIQTCLATKGWEKTWGWNGNFKDTAADAYNLIYQQSQPLYSKDDFAYFGGWPFIFPDSDPTETAGQSFLLMTVKDSEPWVEVWEKGREFRVFQRIT